LRLSAFNSPTQVRLKDWTRDIADSLLAYNGTKRQNKAGLCVKCRVSKDAPYWTADCDF
jgi:hypothetical protein